MGWTSESLSAFLSQTHLLSSYRIFLLGVLASWSMCSSNVPAEGSWSCSRGAKVLVGLSIYLSIDRSIDQSIYLSIYLSIYMRVYLLVHTTSIMYVYIYIHTYKAISNPSICIMCIYICIRILYVYGSPHLCLFPYHLLRPQVWFEGARLVEKKGTAAAIFLGSWNPHFSCVSHENGWPSGG